MKLYRLIPLVLLAATCFAQTPFKVGVINIQATLASTKEGQQAATTLQAKFEPRSKEIEQMRNEIASLRDKLNKGQNTMSEAARNDLVRQIDEKTKRLNRSTEDAQAEFGAEQNRVLQELGQKVMAVIDKYARDNGYALVVDISNPQSGVLFASNSIDVTQQVIELYDQSATTPAPAPAASAPPASAPSAAPKPAATKSAPAPSSAPQQPGTPKPAPAKP